MAGPHGNAPLVLTVAGSDSSGGAGIQADLGAFAAHGLRGASAITAVTAQHAAGILCVHPLPPEVVTAQIEAAAADGPIAAAKTGMLATGAIVDAVAERVAALALRLVVDPVLASSRGRPLLDDAGAAALMTRLLPLAAVATPNRMEAERLAGMPIASVADARTAARRIRALGPAAVIVTGGHLPVDPATVIDVVDDGVDITEIAGPRDGGAEGHRVHGTGCAFSAALTAALAAGHPIVAAAAHAQRYVADGIRRARPVGRRGGLAPGAPDAVRYTADQWRRRPSG